MGHRLRLETNSYGIHPCDMQQLNVTLFSLYSFTICKETPAPRLHRQLLLRFPSNTRPARIQRTTNSPACCGRGKSSSGSRHQNRDKSELLDHGNRVLYILELKETDGVADIDAAALLLLRCCICAAAAADSTTRRNERCFGCACVTLGGPVNPGLHSTSFTGAPQSLPESPVRPVRYPVKIDTRMYVLSATQNPPHHFCPKSQTSDPLTIPVGDFFCVRMACASITVFHETLLACVSKQDF